MWFSYLCIIYHKFIILDFTTRFKNKIDKQMKKT